MTWPPGRRFLAVVAGLLAAIALGLWLLGPAGTADPAAPTTGVATDPPQPGGSLVASVRGEPRTFNRFSSRDTFTDLFTLLTQASLVRINRVTDELEPWLAERWTSSEDGLAHTIVLRPGLRFSDGTPFTSADVKFAFDAVYDPRTASPLRDVLQVQGEILTVAAPDPHTVTIEFPAPYGPGLRLLDGLPILPKHRLEPANRAGTLAGAWGVTTEPADVVGLGPFVFREYRTGERLVFERNPHYWRRDARGAALPYLDRLILEIVPDQNAELVRLQAGQIDLTQTELRPDDYLPLRRAADQGIIELHDLGIGLDADALWFSLGRDASATDGRPWLQREELRRAISLAVDREAFVNTVFLGAAVPLFGPVTPGNARWYAEGLGPIPHDPARARELLAGLGLIDRTGDGLLDDEGGATTRFAVLVLRGNTAAERGASFIREDLGRIGLTVDVVGLEFGAFIERLVKGDYDAVYYRLQTTDTDPAGNLDFWLSSGSAHVWNIGQASPATEWEREIDRLVREQARLLDYGERKALFDRVQQIFREHEPAIYFAVQRLFVATGRRVAHATPAVLRPQLLWNAEALSVRTVQSTE